VVAVEGEPDRERRSHDLQHGPAGHAEALRHNRPGHDRADGPGCAGVPSPGLVGRADVPAALDHIDNAAAPLGSRVEAQAAAMQWSLSEA
jgi:hypothetical protein